MGEPIDLSPLHRELDRLKRQLCHCELRDECVGCKGMEMVRQQVQAVVAAASQPVLLQVAQEASAKDMMAQFGQMQERLMGDPEIRRAAETMQERLMEDPETRRLLEELMRHFPGAGDPETGAGGGSLPPAPG
ncbi:MAG TPA: hypothetical protein VMW49_00345 [Candidatus Dormibacteraeota bacterium]|nr:hypothetical protein [Candidatus Dormibacteraeota bacterium]